MEGKSSYLQTSPDGRGLAFLRTSLSGKVSGKDNIKYLSLSPVLCDQDPKPIQQQTDFSLCFLSAVDVKAPLVALYLPHHAQLDFEFAEPTTESMKSLGHLISGSDLVTSAKLVINQFSGPARYR